MPSSQATLLSCCRRRLGVIALLLSLTPGLSIAAAASGELKRSDALDMRRAGKVSEDERAVLRIEWRAGMSGVEADRSMQEIMAKLRQMEASAVTVNQLLRNMPNEKPAAPKPAAAKPKPPAAATEADEGGVDWRLMAGNLTALVLVGIWWTGRRKAQRAAAALEAELAAKARAEPGLLSRFESVESIPEVLPAGEPSSANMAQAALTLPPAIEVRLNSLSRVEPDAMTEKSMERAATPAPLLESASANTPEPVFDFKPLPAPDFLPVTHETEAPAVLTPIAESPLAASPDATGATAATDLLVLPALDVNVPESQSTPPVPETPDADLSIDFVLDASSPAAVAEVAEPTTAVIEIVTEPAEAPTETSLHMAEIMLSMGLEGDAAKALVDFSEANPKDVIHHLLKLLGIYRKRGLQEEFRITAEKLSKSFNIQAEDWAKTGSGEAPSLEGFPRVSQHVQSIWGQTEECITYLRHLIEDNRDGSRAGFPQAVAEEILLLIDILDDSPGSPQDEA